MNEPESTKTKDDPDGGAVKAWTQKEINEERDKERIEAIRGLLVPLSKNLPDKLKEV